MLSSSENLKLENPQQRRDKDKVKWTKKKQELRKNSNYNKKDSKKLRNKRK